MNKVNIIDIESNLILHSFIGSTSYVEGRKLNIYDETRGKTHEYVIKNIDYSIHFTCEDLTYLGTTAYDDGDGTIVVKNSTGLEKPNYQTEENVYVEVIENPILKEQNFDMIC